MEAESVLSDYIVDYGTNQFLQKNIYWNGNGEMAWRFNLKVIAEQIEIVGEATPDTICNVPALFIRGEKSTYMLDSDVKMLQDIFTHNMLETIAGAGHWVHAEKPKEFFDTVIHYIK